MPSALACVSAACGGTDASGHANRHGHAVREPVERSRPGVDQRSLSRGPFAAHGLTAAVCHQPRRSHLRLRSRRHSWRRCIPRARPSTASPSRWMPITLFSAAITSTARRFSATAQLLDMKKLHLYPAVQSSGPLTNLIDLQTVLAWELLEQMPVPPAMTPRAVPEGFGADPAGRLRELHSRNHGDGPSAEGALLPQCPEAQSELHAGHAAVGQDLLRRTTNMNRRRRGSAACPRTIRLRARPTSCWACRSSIAAISTRRSPRSAFWPLGCR